MKSKKIRMIFVGIVIAMIVILALSFIVSGNRNINNHLSLGDKYLEDLEYEQALAEYRTVLDLSPGNKAAMAGIENTCLQYTDTLFIDVEKISIERLESFLTILEENFQLTKLESIQEKENEVNKLIADKKEEKERENEAAEEVRRQAVETLSKEEEYEKWQEELDAEVRGAEAIYFMISEWASKEQVYMTTWNWYYWNNIEEVTISAIEGKDIYEVEIQGGPSRIEYYIYEVNKNTLQGKLMRFFAEDFQGGFTDEVTYTDSSVIDFAQYSGQEEDIESMGNRYQINVYDADENVVRSKYSYINFEYNRWEWEERDENDRILSQFTSCYFSDQNIHGWSLRKNKYKRTGGFRSSYSADYDAEMNLIKEWQ